jgi:uncharacterized repeat protein (TIGR01451 family)
VVTCTRAALAAGTSAPTIDLAVTAPAQAGSLTNTASVSSDTTDPDPTDDSDSVTTSVTARANLSIVKSGPATVAAGGSVTYALDVFNAGPSDAVAVTVTDALPTGVAFVSASGTGWTCGQAAGVVTCTRPALPTGTSAPTITVVVTAPAQAGTLVNTAIVSTLTIDPVPGNNSSSVSTSVTAVADLSIVKSGPATVTAGGSASYSLAVANAGPSDAVNVSVTDTLPAGTAFVSAAGTGWTCGQVTGVVTCTRAVLAVGPAPAITIVVTAPAQGGSITNSAEVSSDTTDPDPSDDSDSVTTTVEASADLSITKSGPVSVTAGGPVTYALTVANAGPSDAVNVSVTDTLPAGTACVSATGTGRTSGQSASPET